MFDPRIETPLTLAEATKLAWLRSRKGRRFDVRSLCRWATNGRNGIKLETLSMGGARFTSEEAIVRFLAATNESATPADRSLHVASAQAALAAEGF